MGLINRMGNVIEARISRLIDGLESPGEALDYSYRRQLELSQKVKRGIAGVVVARKRLEMQKASMDDEAARLGRDAQEALNAGREDLAEIAVQRKVRLAGQAEGLTGQIAALRQEQDRLIDMSRRLETKIESFCAEKEAIKAQYSAAQAKVTIREATAGLGRELDYVGYAVRMAQDRTKELQARGAALDELAEAGAIEDIGGTGSVLERELCQARSTQAVKAEMDRLKAGARQAAT